MIQSKTHDHDHGSLPKFMSLWDLHESDYESWVSLGMGEIPLSEYRMRLVGAYLSAQEQGIDVLWWRGSPGEMLRQLETMGLPNTSESRASAIAVLASSSMLIGRDVVMDTPAWFADYGVCM